MSRRHAVVLGGGLVGLTSTRILLDCGWSVRLCRSGLRQSRPIVLAEHSWKILEDIWQCRLLRLCRHHLLSGRSVRWTPDAPVAEVPIASLSLDAAELSEALESRLRAQRGNGLAIEDVPDDADLPGHAVVIDARGAPAPDVCQMVCGRRAIRTWPNLPADPTLTGRSELRAGRGFWIFLLPTARDRMSVQIATPTEALDRKEVVSGLLAHAGDAPSLAAIVTESVEELLARPSVALEIAPRLGPTVCTPTRFSVGDRAMTFDPICGDGTGQGIKSAILAVAAANALDVGHAPDRVTRHVAARHAFAFRTHLTHCVGYYEAITSSACWRGEVQSSHESLGRLDALEQLGKESFRLRFDAKPGQSRGRAGPRLESVEANTLGQDSEV